MADINKRQAAIKFAEKWQGKGYEKGESQKFWIELLQDVFGIKDVFDYISFEEQVHLDHTSFIDAYIPSVKVMIEQKGLGKSLDKPIKQSDGTMLTPFQQAKRYITELPVSQHPRWVITCNFALFHIYDMEHPSEKPIKVALSDLYAQLDAFKFIVSKDVTRLRLEEKISIRAGEITGKLYDALIKQYADPESEETLRSLNQLCVRLVFCLYAEDAGIFKDNQFHDYLAAYKPEHIRKALIELFKMLDTPDDKRDPDEEKSLLAFPYVNGGLFKDETIRIPQFNEEIKTLLLDEASAGIDWSDISPTIFGAVFESTLNPETRRSGGMHYTSVENIHKVIDPLFLDELKAELDEILVLKQDATIKKRVAEFQKKLSELTFLDPACGSGNFLTETYLSLRRLENAALEFMYKEQMVLDTGDVIRVSIGQFNGIEINDFAVTVARTALWIAESQMMHETESIVKQQLEFLPLKTDATIVEGNALRLDWADVVLPEKLSYIMGNPPFVGASMMNAKQKEEVVSIFGKIKLSNSIDYVGGWYFKAAEYMSGTNISAAFVSTNSITQGEQVAPLWGTLYKKYGINIIYAYRTFIWNSEASEKAHVHCVIIGFCTRDIHKQKLIFDSNDVSLAKNINAYILDAPNVCIESKSKPICDVPSMTRGSQPTDDGNFILSEKEREELIKADTSIECCVRRYVGARDFLNNDEKRYCLWLRDISPTIYSENKEIMRRLNNISEFRKKSSAEPTRKTAATPHLFFSATHKEAPYLIVPSASSERRKYIPIGFMPPEVIASNLCSIIPNANIYHFGVMTSSVHMAWVRAVAGRLKSDYRYTGSVVYNNFPWCEPTTEQKERIEETAQTILNARKKYFSEARANGKPMSLAKLYGKDMIVFTDLCKAHQENDKAVLAAYGLPKNATENEIVTFLFKRYVELTEKEQ